MEAFSLIQREGENEEHIPPPLANNIQSVLDDLMKFLASL